MSKETANPPFSSEEDQKRLDQITRIMDEIANLAKQTNQLTLLLKGTISSAKKSRFTTLRIEHTTNSLTRQTIQIQRDVTHLIRENSLSTNTALNSPVRSQEHIHKTKSSAGTFKLNAVSKGQIPRWRQYAEWVVGKTTPFDLLKYEVIISLFGNFPGALGLYLRSKFYPWILGDVQANTVFGKGVTLRHPHKIRIGKNVTIDDGCVLDAKGKSNMGITIGDGVYIGRNSIVYCKGGDIEIHSGANISSNCEIFSGHHVVIGKKTLIAAYCYILSGATYDYTGNVPFSEQEVLAKGTTDIGEDCWLGAKVVVLDGITIGDGAVVGAGAVVTKDLPTKTVSMGIPAKSFFHRDNPPT